MYYNTSRAGEGSIVLKCNSVYFLTVTFLMKNLD